MTPADLRCATCSFWSRNLPSITTGLRKAKGADENLGTCQFLPPVVVALGGSAVSMQPETHSTRGCNQWLGGFEGPDGPDGGHEAAVVDLSTRRAAA
ncbi:hypothetical protein J2Y58_002924 [Sphingomonas sp. BE138]|uniref:hypothetical protein n=1 Tax=Sphingomonas sp. BE138 TaxID=2817845 RepID=UPI002861C932|nr:hypothetical protein [Sphingomonas sp. BE138]MDR6789551.1 hypothetical protein [Sphingomonas sp. BE138]